MDDLIFDWKSSTTPLNWFVDMYELNKGYKPGVIFVCDGDTKTIEMKCDAKAVARVHDETVYGDVR